MGYRQPIYWLISNDNKMGRHKYECKFDSKQDRRISNKEIRNNV